MKSRSQPSAARAWSAASAAAAAARALSICPLESAVRPQQPASTRASSTPAARSRCASASPTWGSWYCTKQSTNSAARAWADEPDRRRVRGRRANAGKGRWGATPARSVTRRARRVCASAFTSGASGDASAARRRNSPMPRARAGTPSLARSSASHSTLRAAMSTPAGHSRLAGLAGDARAEHLAELVRRRWPRAGRRRRARPAERWPSRASRRPRCERPRPAGTWSR